VTIAQAALDVVIAHAIREAPRECCGILIGSATGVSEASAARNIDERSTRFRIDPQDHINAIRRARQRGLNVLGFYHSHPHSSAVPSETDRAEASYPDHLYLIVGLASEVPEIRLFRLTGGNFLELAFVPVD
jgi:[CysO sulfur-carrier protein]-S-L-cysteine hydrolase